MMFLPHWENLNHATNLKYFLSKSKLPTTFQNWLSWCRYVIGEGEGIIFTCPSILLENTVSCPEEYIGQIQGLGWCAVLWSPEQNRIKPVQVFKSPLFFCYLAFYKYLLDIKIISVTLSILSIFICLSAQ